MGIAVDMISGRPAGAEPLIQTWGRRARRTAARPQSIVIVPAGVEPANAEKLSLWRAPVRMHLTDEGRLHLCAPEREWDVYRSRATWRDPGVIVWPVPREPTPVAAEEISVLPELPSPPAPSIDPAATQKNWTVDPEYPVEERVRVSRGDYAIGHFADVAPWQLLASEAETAGVDGLTTAELYRGVREEHGRWQGYIGLGSMLRQVATCDTREEALMLATAHLWRAWIDRVEEIREARGGDLSWGWPIPSPVLEDEDPQKSY